RDPPTLPSSTSHSHVARFCWAEGVLFVNHSVRLTFAVLFGFPGMVCGGSDSSAGGLLNLDQEGTYMVVLINRDRQTQGIGTVTLDMTASRAAQAHTDDMVEFGYLSHWGR